MIPPDSDTMLTAASPLVYIISFMKIISSLKQAVFVKVIVGC